MNVLKRLATFHTTITAAEVNMFHNGGDRPWNGHVKEIRGLCIHLPHVVLD
jgi:hypothetical protein